MWPGHGLGSRILQSHLQLTPRTLQTPAARLSDALDISWRGDAIPYYFLLESATDAWVDFNCFPLVAGPRWCIQPRTRVSSQGSAAAVGNQHARLSFVLASAPRTCWLAVNERWAGRPPGFLTWVATQEAILNPAQTQEARRNALPAGSGRCFSSPLTGGGHWRLPRSPALGQPAFYCAELDSGIGPVVGRQPPAPSLRAVSGMNWLRRRGAGAGFATG